MQNIMIPYESAKYLIHKYSEVIDICDIDDDCTILCFYSEHDENNFFIDLLEEQYYNDYLKERYKHVF